LVLSLGLDPRRWRKLVDLGDLGRRQAREQIFQVWHMLWRWARRRHPEKSCQWVAKRYFHSIGPHQWKFAADTGDRTPEGKPTWLKLVYASDTKIRRHLKIRAEANPFDPDWQDYFAERAFRKKFGIHRHEAGIKPS
jgi:RNA-directed DNA polymerase